MMFKVPVSGLGSKTYTNSSKLVTVKDMEVMQGFVHSINLLEKLYQLSMLSVIDNKLQQINNEELNFIRCRQATLFNVAPWLGLDSKTIVNLYSNMCKLNKVKLIGGEKLLVPKATMRDIPRTNIVIWLSQKQYCNYEVYEHCLYFGGDNNQVDAATVFQVLANNYQHDHSKLDWLSFFARHANQDGFLHMAQTQLKLAAISKNIKINTMEQKTNIFLEYDVDGNDTGVRLSEYFEVEIVDEKLDSYQETVAFELPYTIDIKQDYKIILGDLIVNGEYLAVADMLNIFNKSINDSFSINLNNKHLLDWRQQILLFSGRSLPKNNYFTEDNVNDGLIEQNKQEKMECRLLCKTPKTQLACI